MIMLLLATTSCSSEEPAAIEPGRTISGDAGKTLIVYFSWGGNTRTVANHIHDLIGGDADRTGRAGERLLSRVENKGGEYGRVRHADCRDAYLGRTPYIGDEKFPGRL